MEEVPAWHRAGFGRGRFFRGRQAEHGCLWYLTGLRRRHDVNMMKRGEKEGGGKVERRRGKVEKGKKRKRRGEERKGRKVEEKEVKEGRRRGKIKGK